MSSKPRSEFNEFGDIVKLKDKIENIEDAISFGITTMPFGTGMGSASIHIAKEVRDFENQVLCDALLRYPEAEAALRYVQKRLKGEEEVEDVSKK